MVFAHNSFKSRIDAISKAKKYHVCLDCRHSQHKNYKNCPECGSTNRQYFMSQAELKRGMLLMAMQAGGTISRLGFQPRYDLHVNQIKIGQYVADAAYYKGDVFCVEDTKGHSKFIDPLSKWKIAHFEAQYQLKINIVAEDKKKSVQEQKEFI